MTDEHVTDDQLPCDVDSEAPPPGDEAPPPRSSARPTGLDAARVALQAAKAAARARGTTTTPGKPKRLASIKRGSGREPVGLGATLETLAADRGWDMETTAGGLADRWADLMPTSLVDLVRPEHYDAEKRVLHLRPTTASAATMLRLTGGQLAAHMNTVVGKELVRTIKVLTPATGTIRNCPEPSGTGVREPEPDPHRLTPQQTSPELAAWREQQAAARAARLAAPPRAPHPLFADVYGTLREPGDDFKDAVTAREDAEERARRAADTHQRALAAARAHRRGDPTPLRTLGAA